MPTYEATARSNEFTVKDIDALRRDLDGLSIDIVEGTGGDPNRIWLHCENTGNGNWPLRSVSEGGSDQETWEIVAPHLAEDQVAVFIEVGAEKMASLNGYAVAINARGERVGVSLADIFDAATTLGRQIDRF